MTRISSAEAERLLRRALNSNAPRSRVKRPNPPKGPSNGESDFRAALLAHGVGLPVPTPEHLFARPRRWRFDFAWPERLVAVEIDGGQWKAGGGRHNTDADREKLNTAGALGWRVLRFSPGQVKRDPAGCVALLRRALKVRP